MTDSEIEFAFIQAGEVRLHVALAGPADGPMVILLHGFPEFWFGWRRQITALASAGWRVVAPDQRGYNLSDKPQGVDAYRLDRLAADLFALADALGRDRFSLVGHDWGAAVAWWAVTQRPERIERLAVMNAPHPALWRHAMTHDPVQRRKSRYVQMLRLPFLPELMVGQGRFRALVGAFASARSGAYSPADLDRYREAWRRPGALTAMINWYRALFRQPLPIPSAGSIPTPTLILWGMRDDFAEPALAEQSAGLCARARIVRFPEATHWLAHDEPAAVNDALLALLAEPLAPS